MAHFQKIKIKIACLECAPVEDVVRHAVADARSLCTNDDDVACDVEVEDDDDDSLRRSGANFGLLRDIFEPRMRKSAKRHLLSFRFKSK